MRIHDAGIIFPYSLLTGAPLMSFLVPKSSKPVLTSGSGPSMSCTTARVQGFGAFSSLGRPKTLNRGIVLHGLRPVP